MSDPDDLGEAELRGWKQIADKVTSPITPEARFLGWVLFALAMAGGVTVVWFFASRAGVAVLP